MTFLGFLVLLVYLFIFVSEAAKKGGFRSLGNGTISTEDDVTKKRENLSKDDLYGASTYDDPWEYYAKNSGRFEDFNEACFYYDIGHDNARDE